ncbi:MAG: putative lipid II flippase FtsW [Christensenellales bacterium]|jgi:cell division protein FtsW
MKQKAARKRPYDFSILLITLILVCFGVLMVFSASFYTAQARFDDGYHYFKKQLLGAAIGLVCMFVLANIDYKKLKKLALFAIIISEGLLLLLLIDGMGDSKNEATRWFSLFGFSIQPAEIAKFALILFMAATISNKREKMKTFKDGLLPNIIVLGALCVPILLQPNFSTVVIMAMLWAVMVFVGGCSVPQLLGLGAVGGAAGYSVATMAGYRVDRLDYFADPWLDPSGKGYQIIQSLYSISAGGLFGVGLGNSRQKLLYLPYGESDFIFSIIAEEFGLIGALALLAAFGFLIWRGVLVAMRCPDLFGTMLATGIVAIIAIQVMVNIAVATKAIPTTGQTLPFISAGSSSLIVMMSGIGVLLAISRSCSRAAEP